LACARSWPVADAIAEAVRAGEEEVDFDDPGAMSASD
jgi:hypothetical protein